MTVKELRKDLIQLRDKLRVLESHYKSNDAVLLQTSRIEIKLNQIYSSLVKLALKIR
jgi:hypothetical protein